MPPTRETTLHFCVLASVPMPTQPLMTFERSYLIKIVFMGLPLYEIKPRKNIAFFLTSSCLLIFCFLSVSLIKMYFPRMLCSLLPANPFVFLLANSKTWASNLDSCPIFPNLWTSYSIIPSWNCSYLKLPVTHGGHFLDCLSSSYLIGRNCFLLIILSHF